MAVPNATRSAHVPTGYEAFSTLAPVKNSPDWERRAAPTRNFEYGPKTIAFSPKSRRGRWKWVWCDEALV
jgi:hypothetical protein